MRIRLCECPRCSGFGMVRSQSVDDMGGDVCPECGGDGEVRCADVRRGERGFTRYVTAPAPAADGEEG